MIAEKRHPQSPVRQLTSPVTTSRFVPSLYGTALVAILGAVLIVALAPRLDTDFWWHLKVGQYIASHHIVPAHDFMTFTFRGHAWTDHEWLAELMLYGLYQLAGLWGPIALFACIICATFGLVYVRMSQAHTNKVLALFVVAAAFMASSASWGPRIQMLTLFFLSAYSLLLFRYTVTRDKRLLVAFPLLMLVWANMHGGFVLGLVLMAITLTGEAANAATRHDNALLPTDLLALAFAFAGTVLTTMVNPNGVRQLLYPLTFILPNQYTNLIQESASPNFHMPVMMVFEGLLLLLIAAALIGRPSLNWTHLFLVLAFTHLAFSQVRNVPLWSVLVAPLVATYLQGAVPALQREFPRFTYRRRPVSNRLGSLLNVIFLVLIAVVYLAEATHYVNKTTLRTAETDNYPAGAVAYMQAHRLPPRVYTTYEWGGYLLWKTFPRYRDFMDSRADTLFNNRMLHDYLALYAAHSNWSTLLNHYRVQDVLVENSVPLAQVLRTDPGWRMVYHDRQSVLFVRV